MPPIETDERNQVASLREYLRRDGYGEVVVSPAIELMVRWEWGRREATDPQGNTVTLDATVVVDRPVRIGSLMILGELEDEPPGTGGALWEDVDIYQVITSRTTPDIKARETRRTLGLMMYKRSLPVEDV